MSNKNPTNTFANRPEDINKNGRPEVPEAIKKLRKASANEIIESYGKILGMTAKEADIYKDSDECTITEKALILNMQRGRIEVVVDRVIGAIPKDVNLNHSGRIDMSDEEYKALMKKHLEEYKKGHNG